MTLASFCTTGVKTASIVCVNNSGLERTHHGAATCWLQRTRGLTRLSGNHDAIWLRARLGLAGYCGIAATILDAAGPLDKLRRQHGSIGPASWSTSLLFISSHGSKVLRTVMFPFVDCPAATDTEIRRQKVNYQKH